MKRRPTKPGPGGRDAGGVGMIALAYANAGQKDKARGLLNELLTPELT